MRKRPFVIFAIFAAICVLALPIWALAKRGSENAAPVDVASQYQTGKELFQINCGVCHTLKAAGTAGLVGPNLDTLLATGPKTPSTVKANQQRVLNAIENGLNGRMPAGVVQGEQAKQVAAFVANNVAYLPSSAAAPASGGG